MPEKQPPAAAANEEAVRQQPSVSAEAAVQRRSCGHCGKENPVDSRFCAGCGQAAATRRSCPGCGCAASATGDICEACGTWLLVGQCRFCGRAINATETFCGQCGNPTAGILCARCGKVSNFDYCKTCLIPLSHQAVESTSATAPDPALDTLGSLLEELAAIGVEEDAGPAEHAVGGARQNTHDEDVARMRAIRHTATSHGAVRPTPRPTLFSAQQKARIDKLAGAVDEERARMAREAERLRLEAEQRRIADAEKQRRLDARIQEELARLSRKSFSSHQEARRYFMGLLASLPEELAQRLTGRGLRWRCHAYNCTHSSPADCADPSRGGVWLLV